MICALGAGQVRCRDCWAIQRRLCIWFLAILVIASIHVHATLRNDVRVWDPASSHGHQEHDSEEERCLCNIAVYSLFYSKVFGRHACSSGDTTPKRGSSTPFLKSRWGPSPPHLSRAQHGAGSRASTGYLTPFSDISNHSIVSSILIPAISGVVSCPSDVPRGIPSRHQCRAETVVPVNGAGRWLANAAAVAAESLRQPLLILPGAPANPDAKHHFPSDQNVTAAAAARDGPEGAADNVNPDGRLIVRFNHFAPADEHRDSLRRVLGPEGPQTWSWLPRRNPAARFPTDFGLLAAAPGCETDLRQRLVAASADATTSSVRDVHIDRRYTGKLSWLPEDGPMRDVVLDLSSSSIGGAAPATAAVDGPDEMLFSVSSRHPGRLVTRFSTEDLTGDDDPEAVLEEGAQKAWRVTQGMQAAAAGLGAAAQDLSYGLELDHRALGADMAAAVGPGWNPVLDVEEVERLREGGGEEELKMSEGGGLTGSRRRVASAEGSAGDSDTGAVAAAESHWHSHGQGRLHDVAAHAAKHHHQQLHPQIHRRRRHRDHFHPHHADGSSTSTSASGSDTESGTAAAAAAPHTGRMGGTMGIGNDGSAGGGGNGNSEGGHEEGQRRRRLHLDLKASSGTMPVMLQADKLWKQGYTGKGVRVGIFDTGIRSGHPHIRNIRERTNWTHQDSLSDGLGHGSFVAGVVGGQDSQCPGFAPDVDMYTFKVFTDDQVSYTSWFLDAFNYAMIVQVNVINLSIGGPDYLDQPFVDKVLEVTSNGILMVSAIGNDGPLYGTLNNPADQNDVIGVGGIDNWDNIASFSSRGMSTWELPRGYGRVKPDVMAYSKDVQGSKIEGGCRSLSGTSVASPVVAGAVCLLASTVTEERRWELLNPASMKQALVEGAVRLNNLNIYEQGSGRINLPNSMAILQSYTPRASVIPARLDLTDCPYMWPFCRQYMYAGALPVMFNATLLNGQGVVGWLEGPPVWHPSDPGGELLHLTFEWSDRLWPWSGFLALYLRVRAAGADFTGLANGVVECVVMSPPGPGEDAPRRSTVKLPLRARIGPVPPRSRRVLWDQFHSLKYPPAYLPRDNLDVKSDILDWHGDHPHTNFHGLYNALRDKGYFLEILGSPATCFDPTQYGALLVVDSEEEWYPDEIAALEAAVSKLGLNLLVFADWYNLASLDQMRFFDDNTRSWWDPATGGANVPALNELLEPYGLALGDAVIHGTVSLAGMRLVISFGSDIAKVPKGGWLHKASLDHAVRRGGANSGQHGYLAGVAHGSAGGHVVVFSDSNCLDRSHMSHNCYDLVLRLLARLLDKQQDLGLLEDSVKLSKPYLTSIYNFTPPARRPLSEYNFTEVSYVLSHPKLVCFPNAACEKQPQNPNCEALLADNNETLSRKAGAAAAENSTAIRTPDIDPDVLKVATGAVGSRGGGSGTTLLVHPDGTAPHRSVLPLGLSGLQLLVLGCLLLMALFLTVWVMRMGTGRVAGIGGTGVGGDGGGAFASVGNSIIGLTAARRDRLSNVRLRGSDV
ncbi:hypothetical protein Vafri_12651 [Volvox africanus]|uniref:Peptidase S8/S53 domain-containing protein n=1 Tax=Volvox africanus TaxID=51714 RepID=A0A8J4BAC4_9CHLO|nr:hypothetical protein Vafri_12651 [Volvox africanus]